MSSDDEDDKQGDLFGEAYARNSDPHTSHSAARSVKGERASKLEQLVWDAVRTTGERGAISDDIVAITGLPWNTISPRLKPLIRKGLLERRLVEGGDKWITRLGHRSTAPQLVHWVKEPKPK